MGAGRTGFHLSRGTLLYQVSLTEVDEFPLGQVRLVMVLTLLPVVLTVTFFFEPSVHFEIVTLAVPPLILRSFW